MQVREIYVNQTEHHRIGDSDWYDTWTDDRRQLFRSMQKEYGRCVSKMYTDVPRPDAAHTPAVAAPIGTRREYDVVPTGWVFSKRMRYEDARGNDPERDYYTREVWVAVREGRNEL